MPNLKQWFLNCYIKYEYAIKLKIIIDVHVFGLTDKSNYKSLKTDIYICNTFSKHVIK